MFLFGLITGVLVVLAAEFAGVLIIRFHPKFFVKKAVELGLTYQLAAQKKKIKAATNLVQAKAEVLRPAHKK